ncbi:sensor histidine kinase [Paenibacillus yanchengensis]|uniref:histidine kinase n=1 Tax=Paenibacillus yanchengensis TaxID=2035833 RepID=A0ABW4YFV9_9BACL
MKFWANPFRSLKGRLIVYLLVYALIPLLLLGAVTLTSMQNIVDNHVESGVRNNLERTKISLENMLSNMDYVSYQLYIDGHVGQKLIPFLAEQKKYEQMEMANSIRQDINFLNFTNPNLGLMLYYFADQDEIMFQNLEVKPEFSPLEQPLLTEMKGETIYGPHETAYRYSENTVFSLIRPMKIPGNVEHNAYIYMETNFKLFEEVLQQSENGMNLSYMVFNNKQQMIYKSNNSDLGQVAVEKLFDEDNKHNKMAVAGHYTFADTSDQGWSIAVFIPKRDFDDEFRKWLWQYGLIALLWVLLAIILALFVWRSVYGPLKMINQEIRLMARSRYDSPVKEMKISEFDQVLQEFQQMRDKVVELFAEIEVKERVKAQLEVEKLLYQINPHFIHNTLNTIQWIARMNGQAEIDRLVSIFTRVLHYNLGKEGGLVKISQEVEAVRDYISLQEIRYDHSFQIHYDLDESLLDYVIPRFILQPVVENALYHGLDEDDGLITVRMKRSVDKPVIVMEVIDNGIGMSAEEIAKATNDVQVDERRKIGLGIGLSYVRRIVISHYGDKGKFEIISEPNKGTTIRFHIPLSLEIGNEGEFGRRRLE